MADKRVLPCHDCTVDCIEGDDNYYMVRDDLWHAHGVHVQGRRNLLCMRCFEKRMGRTLRLSDLKHLWMNQAVVKARFPAELEAWSRTTAVWEADRLAHILAQRSRC